MPKKELKCHFCGKKLNGYDIHIIPIKDYITAPEYYVYACEKCHNEYIEDLI